MNEVIKSLFGNLCIPSFRTWISIEFCRLSELYPTSPLCPSKTCVMTSFLKCPMLKNVQACSGRDFPFLTNCWKATEEGNSLYLQVSLHFYILRDTLFFSRKAFSNFLILNKLFKGHRRGELIIFSCLFAFLYSKGYIVFSQKSIFRQNRTKTEEIG